MPFGISRHVFTFSVLASLSIGCSSGDDGANGSANAGMNGAQNNTSSNGQMGAPDMDEMNAPDASASVDEPDMRPPAPVMPEGATTYHEHIRPLMERACVSCHTEGGIGTFVMSYQPDDWADGARPWWAMASVNSVELGEMPPWMPTDDCLPLVGARGLSDDDVAAFSKWASDGFWEGAPEDYAPPMMGAPAVESGLGEPSFRLELPEYQPRTEYADDYRCFVLDHDFEVESYIKATDIKPGAEDVVHHVILYLIPPSEVGSIERKDERDEGLGYTCFGDPGSSLARNIGGWVPGFGAPTERPGHAHVVPAGAKIVAQVHYNTINVPSGEEAPLDQTSALVWAYPEGEEPTHEIRVVPLANVLLSVDPGDASSSQVKEYTFPYDATLIGTTPHMHTLGKSIKLELVRSAENQCVIDIPRWDFNWQQSYGVRDGHELSIKRGDKFLQTCVYDNSPGNQQVIDGQQVTPEQVYWGDGTLDEMCLTYVVLSLPLTEERGIDCSNVDECLASCSAQDSDCFIDCALGSSSDCTQCAFDATFDCAGPKCATQGVKLSVCERSCDDRAGEGLACLLGECAQEWSDFHECAIETFQSGACEVGVCGAE